MRPLVRHRFLLAFFALAFAFVSAAALAPLAAWAQAPNPLPVPWIGQAYCQDDCRGSVYWQGRNNCGPASLAMVANANGLARGTIVSRARLVRDVKTLTEGTDNCSYTSRAELDRGARSLGLCVRQEDWSTRRIEADTQSCLPVVTYVDERTMPWHFSPSSYAGSDHIVVATGFSGDSVTINDPLENRLGDTSCSPMPKDAENRVYGKANSRYDREDFDAAAYLADFGWWGKAYGDPLGGCDVARCNTAGGGSASADPAAGGPYVQVTFRMASLCSANQVRLYYVTDRTAADGAFHEQWAKSKTIQNDGFFHTYTLTFDGDTSHVYWRGTLRKLRIDPPEKSGCLVAVSWIGVHDLAGHTVRAWTFPTGQGANGWWAKDTVTTGFMGPFWAMHTISRDPWLENDRVDLPVGR